MFNRLIRPLTSGAVPIKLTAALTQFGLLLTPQLQNCFPKPTTYLSRKGNVVMQKSTRSATSVLIVDDHPVVLSGCRSLFASDSTVKIDEATDAKVRSQGLCFAKA